MTKPVIGAQMYTVREFTKTLPDFAASLKKVAETGYTAVQLSGQGPLDPQAMATAVADAGLTVAATHVSWDRFLNDLDAVIEEHRLWKCSHAAIGGLAAPYHGLDGLQRFVDELAPVAARLAAAGMDFSYHNHNHELARYDGQTWLARLYAAAPPDQLKAEIDTYWIQAGGGDPAAWVRACAGREPLLHLKDMCVTPEREQRFAEIGEGNLDWSAILSAAEEGGVEFLLVEQDQCYERDPFESLAISYRNLKAMGYRSPVAAEHAMSETTTPMMRQYRRIRGELAPGVILLFRLGDFYEMFFDDAKRAAPILDIALTRRNQVPMCGLPYHALDGYLAKLIRAGCKVAICEQTEDPATAKGVVRREVTRIVTPGTVTEANILESKRHHYLAGVCRAGDGYGLALLDLSTGLFLGMECAGPDEVADALRRTGPTECAVPAEQAPDPGLVQALDRFPGDRVTACEDWTFAYDAAHDTLIRHFAVRSLEGFGCEGNQAVVGAAGGVLHYVQHDLRRAVGHVRALRLQRTGDHLLLDEATCRNLDLVGRGSRDPAALLGVLDATRTPMGGRLLRDWILQPLARVDRIAQRHDAVEAFCRTRGLLHAVRDAMGEVRDLERLIARIGAGGGNARDLRALCASLAALPAMRELLAEHPVALLRELGAAIALLPATVALIERALVEDPPATLKDGGIMQPGYHAELDELRRAATEGRQWLAEYQTAEQERTGIRTLKVRHNKVFGYYIEVSKAQLDHVPEDFIRKQTLVNAERFITPQLKEYEGRILGAQGRAVELEYELFLEVREQVVGQTAPIQATAAAVAQVDVLAALADRAMALGYTRPIVNNGDTIRIRAGRHPVIEQMPEAERFVPNDTLLDGVRNQLAIITGPNMAGKSTYIRQVALIVTMAQMGSYVPAEEAEIGVVDRVFTRVGASDDLARGRSTFMVEMQETANILNNATPASLIVLDEIGRGTSTFDGISIAWAVAEYLHNNRSVKAKTLFATHYHELTDLALTLDGVKNYNVLVREQGERIAFLRRIAPGGSDKSYGIQVARLAGLPEEVIGRSREILANLEEGELAESGQPKLARHRPRKSRADNTQLDLFAPTPRGETKQDD